MASKKADSGNPPPPLLLPSRKYGAPLYGAAWPKGKFVYVCGGGGSASSGIKNRLVFFECKDGQLTDQLGDYHFAQDCPMRIVVSPDGACILVAMGQGGIRRLLLDSRGEVPKVSEPTDEVYERVSKVKGEVRCLGFSPSGDQLALGGVDGSLRVLDWPSLNLRLDRTGSDKLSDGVRDVDLAPGSGAQQVAVVLDNGSVEVWDWGHAEMVCQAGFRKGNLKMDGVLVATAPGHICVQRMPKALHGAQFTRLRYAPLSPTAPPNGQRPAAPPAGPQQQQGDQQQQQQLLPGAGTATSLYALMNNRSGCFITVWTQQVGTGLLALQRWRKVGDAPGACLDISRDGLHLAVGTSEGAAMVLSAATLTPLTANPKAHMVFSTGIYFAADGTHALSISADASATVVAATPPTRKGSKVWRTLGILLILLMLCTALFLFAIRQPDQLQPLFALLSQSMDRGRRMYSGDGADLERAVAGCRPGIDCGGDVADAGLGKSEL